MAVEWREKMHGTFLARVAVVEGCDQSIIGRDGAWFWLVCQGECDLAEGEEPDLADAQEMAEAAAHRLAHGTRGE